MQQTLYEKWGEYRSLMVQEQRLVHGEYTALGRAVCDTLTLSARLPPQNWSVGYLPLQSEERFVELLLWVQYHPGLMHTHCWFIPNRPLKVSIQSLHFTDGNTQAQRAGFRISSVAHVPYISGPHKDLSVSFILQTGTWDWGWDLPRAP